MTRAHWAALRRVLWEQRQMMSSDKGDAWAEGYAEAVRYVSEKMSRIVRANKRRRMPRYVRSWGEAMAYVEKKLAKKQGGAA